MIEPKISIITVVFNNHDLLERAILSVLNQSYKNIEYIVIDGGSTDGSVEIIRKYENRIAYWVSEKDEGLYDAMNKGVKRATGDWIVILNSDDYYLDNKVIEKAVGLIDPSEKKFYYFTMLREEEDGWRSVYRPKISFWNKWLLYYSAYIPHMTLWVRKSQYDLVGFYDTSFRIAADHDFILRLLKKFDLVFIDFPLSVMRMGGLSSRDPKKTFQDFRDVTVKNGLPRFLAELIFRFKMWKYK